MIIGLHRVSSRKHHFSSLGRTTMYPIVSGILYPQLKIPVSGTKLEGHIYVSSSRDAPFQRYYGKVGGNGGTGREPSNGNNPDSHFHCSEMIAIVRIHFSNLEKFHGLDTKPVLWLLAQSRCFMQCSLLNCPLLMLLTVKNLTALLI